MKHFILLAGGLLLTVSAGAQNFEDAVRYSYLTAQSTARSSALGGAVGAVGADFGALSVNPAGIGLYQKGAFTFSSSIRANDVSGTYNPNGGANTGGNSVSANANAFSIANIGYVSVTREVAQNSDFDQRQTGGWRSFGFAIGFNRVADFNRNYTYEGRNTRSSGSEAFVLDANEKAGADGKIPTNSKGFLAYDTYLTDYDSARGYFTNADYQLGGLNQRQIVEERGGTSEIVLAFGGNHNNKLMLGGTLGIPIFRYTRSSTFSERDADNTIPLFERFQYNQNLNATGVGVNLKLGAIYKPTDQLRVGIALHSPTWMGVQETYDARILNQRVGYVGLTDTPRTSGLDPNVFSYNIQTAWRGVISAMTIIAKQGFVSVDYEYVGYQNSRLVFETRENQATSGTGAFAEDEIRVNNELKERVHNASNLRIGGELKLGSQGSTNNFYLRAGFGLYGSPYKNTFLASSRKDYTGGLGFRGQLQTRGYKSSFRSYKGKDYVLELAFVQSQFENGENPYIGQNTSPEAKLKSSFTNATLTFGLNF